MPPALPTSALAQRYLALYQQGYFPMANPRGQVSAYCYDPRGVLLLEEFRLAPRLQRWLRSNPYQMTHNRAFSQVIQACGDRETTWLHPQIIQTFNLLHQAGWAHSVEAWQGDNLVGGLYGLALGGTFCGESMFSRANNASKACLVELVQQLNRAGFAQIDCQEVTPTLAQFGAKTLPFPEYFTRFQALLSSNSSDRLFQKE